MNTLTAAQNKALSTILHLGARAWSLKMFLAQNAIVAARKAGDKAAEQVAREQLAAARAGYLAREEREEQFRAKR